jgi:clan AA aspartic protease (TIGR02281 family)
MATNTPPELAQLFGSTFIRVGIALACILAAYLFYRHATRPEMEVISANEVRLQRQADGHYHINGAINGQPVRFMLDTGASMVSVSREMADRTGLECEQPAVFTTANGKIDGCIATREEVSFGNVRLFDVDIAIMPNMDETGLLGMNALSKFDLQQTDGTLTIRHKQAE